MKCPGQLPNPEAQAWFDDQMAAGGHRRVNPCVRLYGSHAAGAKCKSCRMLIRKGMSKTYFKCGLRRNTNGPATDHRANWPACARYVPVAGE